ncbi:MAG: hypothetical protein KDJ65_00030 [Anaerolineae bacterium]|nr:hypothetical protein [Anaerolineae bacterium]
MRLLHPFQQTKEQSPTAYSLLDIGRDTVKAAVVLITPEQSPPQVVGYGLADTNGHDITGGRLEAGAVTRPVNEALTQAEDSAEKYVGHKVVPDDVILALAGRATVGQLFTVKRNRAKPNGPISTKELSNLRLRAEKMAHKGLARNAFEGGQWQPLAVTDAGLRLDTHLVLDGVGLTGRTLAFSVFGVAGQAAALRALEVVANRLDLTVSNIVASPQALASTIPYAESIILDVGFSGTDICLLKDDALIGADWTPFGGYFFTQSLARSMNIDINQARLLKHAMSTDDLDVNKRVMVETCLDEPRQRWYDAVMELLMALSAGQPLPKRIYMTGGGSLLPGLDKLLRTNPAPFDAAPEVLRLGVNSSFPLQVLTEALDFNIFSLTLSLTVGLP